MNKKSTAPAGITLCITMGKRPDLLKKTLTSLLSTAQFEHVIAINDFRDEATNQAFKEVCPDGELISLPNQLGHHGAVDHMYKNVNTPWVFHCEDDWEFTNKIDIQNCIELLKNNPNITQACFRNINDFEIEADMIHKIMNFETQDVKYSKLDKIHPEWHGFTFNPHIASIEIWKSCNGFSQFRKERHISRHLRQQGKFTAYIQPAACVHIGDEVSVSHENKKPNKAKLLRRKIKKSIRNLLNKFTNQEND